MTTTLRTITTDDLTIDLPVNVTDWRGDCYRGVVDTIYGHGFTIAFDIAGVDSMTFGFGSIKKIQTDA